MPRHAARRDDNHAEIRDALRQIPGVTVFDSAALAGGFGDLVVGYMCKNFILEIKDGGKVKSAQQLTPEERKFHATWKGHIAVVTSIDEALAAIGLGVRL